MLALNLGFLVLMLASVVSFKSPAYGTAFYSSILILVAAYVSTKLFSTAGVLKSLIVQGLLSRPST